MNALQVMDRSRKEVIQVSSRKHDINVQYLDNIFTHNYISLEDQPMPPSPAQHSTA